ncbi:MAG: diguanylate cyclase domain-containing protein [Nitrospiraceae bacterium]
MQKLELSGVKTDLYPKTRKLVNDAYEKLRREKLDPWQFFNTKPLDCTDCRGKRIHYEGIKYEGSPREVFWGGYIDPCLEDSFIEIFETIAQICRASGSNPAVYLDEAARFLDLFIYQVFKDMAHIDQVLQGEGFPGNVPERDISNEIVRMQRLIAEHLKATKALQLASGPSTVTPADLDPLMKIASRKQMDLDLPNVYAHATETAQPFAVLMIDFDDLKDLNEKIGHLDADK